jgi:hypothetical protein
MPTPELCTEIDLQSLRSMDDRELQALMSAIDLPSMSNAGLREYVESRLSTSGSSAQLIHA